MPQFINPWTQTFIVLYLVIYSTYKKVGDTADLSGSLDLALYRVLNSSFSKPQSNFILYHGC